MAEPLVISRFHRTTLLVDGRAIRVRVDRLNVEQLAAFSRDLTMHDTPATERAISIRKPGDEMERKPPTAAKPDEPGPFVIDDSEIQSRRLAEMTPEQRDEWARAHAADTAAATAFLRRAAGYVHIEPGQVKAEDADGSLRDVTEAVDLLELFGTPVLGRAVIMAVWSENHLPSAAKNVFRSLLDSGSSFDGRDLAADGGAPVAPAANVENTASVTSGVVTASTGAGRSGLTRRRTSSSRRVRSSPTHPKSLRRSNGSR